MLCYITCVMLCYITYVMLCYTTCVKLYNMKYGMLYNICLTNRFHVAVRLFSNRSQMTSKCHRNKKVAHELQAYLPRTA